MSEEISTMEANASMTKLYKRINELARKIDNREISREEAIKELEKIANDDSLWVGFILLMARKGYDVG
jgi:uncharacterized membrane protein YjjP (DUF1212 family)